MSVNSVSNILGLTKVTNGPLRKIAQNSGCLYKIGRSYYIDLKEIERIKDECRVAPVGTNEPEIANPIGQGVQKARETVQKLKQMGK